MHYQPPNQQSNFQQYAKIPTQFLGQNMRYILWFLTYYIMAVLFYALILSQPIFITAIVCAFYFAVAIVIALLLGDKILKIIEGIRPIETRREAEYLIPLFESVYFDAITTFPNVPRVDLCMLDSPSINAFAIGSHTVAVTQGAIDTFSEDELKAVIAHEIAHIYYGHSKVAMLNMLGNGAFSLHIVFIRWALRFFDALHSLFTGQSGGFFSVLLTLLCKVLNMLVNAFLFLGNIILSGNSRKNEFTADRFAHQVGYGKELTEALYLLHKMSLGDNQMLIQRMMSSHPRTSKRINKLEELQEQEHRQKARP